MALEEPVGGGGLWGLRICVYSGVCVGVGVG